MRQLTLALTIFGFCGCENGLSPVDSMQVQLQGGTFTMGSTAPCAEVTATGAVTVCTGDRVEHAVAVSPFSLDVTEVTQLQYAACAQSGACPVQFTFDAAHKDEPALVDDPDAARAYCASKGLRLPTEAEFEFASRVAGDGKTHTYPWGDSQPDCSHIAFAGCGVTGYGAVGTNALDVSAAGVHDLAGSAPEWVDDNYVAAIGCVDRLGYGDLCWGKSGGCAQSRCTADGAACAKGCLPLSDDVGSTGMGAQVTSTPVCPQASMSQMAQDPVVKTPSGLGVLRGGSFADGNCALAGYTRRHAEPRRFLGGFRCAKSADATKTPKPATSYRFALTGCTTPMVTVVVKAGDVPAAYSLDVFPSSAQPMMTMTADGSGQVQNVPCDAVFVVHPMTTGVFTVATTVMCTSGGRFDATGAGDAPAVGIDELSLAMSCGG